MALRPLDNALPIASERPKKQAIRPKKKKQAKVAAPIKKQLPDAIGVNDETQAPLPPPSGDSTIDYISSENLAALTDPQTAIQSLEERLESKDWIAICDSLNDTRRFALYHSDLLIPLLEKVVLVLVKSMKNPRSALCKTAIMASSDIFKAYGDKLLDSVESDAFDEVILQLLLKASQDKKFVCEEAEKALSTMVASLDPLSLLDMLRVCAGNSNPRLRAKAAVSISNCVSRVGMETLTELGLVAMIQMGADLLNDRLPEAREAARRTILAVYEVVTESQEQKQESWRRFCQASLPYNVKSVTKFVISQ